MADSIFKSLGQRLGFGDADDADIAKRTTPAMDTLGSTGQTTVGGYVTVMDRLPALAGPLRWRTYREITLNTAIIATGVRLLIRLIGKSEWAANPPEGQEDNKAAKDAADAVYDMMFDMASPWATVIRKLAMFPFNGFAVLEWTAKRRDDGLIGIADVESRPCETIIRWNVDPSGTVLGCFQRTTASNEVELPRDKIIYAVDDVLTESPEGVGLFRHLAVISHKLRAFEDLEQVGFENDLRGIPVAYGPMGELLDQAKLKGPAEGASWLAGMLKPLKDFVQGHVRNKELGVVLPSDTYRTKDEAQTPSAAKKWSVELLQGNATGFDGIAHAIKRLNSEAALLLGVEHILVGAEGGSGSHALSKVKTDGFYLLVTAILTDCVEIMERDWLGPIARLNGWDDEIVPTLAVEAISETDVNEVADVLLKMAQAGAVLTPDDPAIGEVRDMLGLSRPPEVDPLDASLLPGRADATKPDQPLDPNAPMPALEKRRKWIKSNRSTRRAAAMMAKRRGA